MIPIFGPLSGMMVEWVNRSGKEGKNIDQIITLAEEEDIIWSTVKNNKESADIIPLEEALIIDETDVRRDMMLKALYDDPLKYIDVLMVAAHNSDVETAHYATTTIAHQQRKFHLGIQKISVLYENDPENETLLDEYIEQIEEYIDSGLLEEYLLDNQRIIYSKVLEKKISINCKDKKAVIKSLRNSIALKQYGKALESSETLKQNWPDDEDAWIETLRVCIEGKDREKLLETIREIQNTPIQWTKSGKEMIQLWIEGKYD